MSKSLKDQMTVLATKTTNELSWREEEQAAEPGTSDLHLLRMAAPEHTSIWLCLAGATHLSCAGSSRWEPKVR